MPTLKLSSPTWFYVVAVPRSSQPLAPTATKLRLTQGAPTDWGTAVPCSYRHRPGRPSDGQSLEDGQEEEPSGGERVGEEQVTEKGQPRDTGPPACVYTSNHAEHFGKLTKWLTGQALGKAVKAIMAYFDLLSP